MRFNPAEWNRLESAFIAWAEQQPSVRAVITVGARERRDPPPDDWSDLDLMLFVTDRDEFARQGDWLKVMGDVWAAMANRLSNGDPEWLVTFAEGYNVDLVLIDNKSLAWLVQANPLPEPFVRGYRVLLDKDGQAAAIPPAQGRPPAPPAPTSEAYNRIVVVFWYTAYYVAKQLCRNELFLAKIRDGNLKECLMNMLVWQAMARGDSSVDIWHMGRFMERWADPQALAELPAVFSHYDAPDSWRGLLASMTLFHRLAMDTAEHYGFTYPSLIDERMSALVETLARDYASLSPEP